MVPVKVYQWCADQRGGFNGDPEQSGMLAEGGQTHGGQEKEQASDKGRLRLVGEQEAFLKILDGLSRFPAQVTDRVKGHGEKEHAGDRQKKPARQIRCNPVRCRGRTDPEAGDQRDMRRRSSHEQPAWCGTHRNQHGQQTGNRWNEKNSPDHKASIL